MADLSAKIRLLQDTIDKTKEEEKARLAALIDTQTKARIAKQDEITRLEQERDVTGRVTDIERAHTVEMAAMDEEIARLHLEKHRLNAIRAASAAAAGPRQPTVTVGKLSTQSHPSAAAVRSLVNPGAGSGSGPGSGAGSGSGAGAGQTLYGLGFGPRPGASAGAGSGSGSSRSSNSLEGGKRNTKKRSNKKKKTKKHKKKQHRKTKRG